MNEMLKVKISEDQSELMTPAEYIKWLACFHIQVLYMKAPDARQSAYRMITDNQRRYR